MLKGSKATTFCYARLAKRYIVFVWSLVSENKWSNIDVIYYEHGALVLLYNNNERATRAFNRLQDAVFDNKALLVLLLPNIQVSINCSSCNFALHKTYIL
jgi:hypothetical protein